MEAMMTSMMKSKMKSKGIASVEELRSLCLESGVKMVACQMTVDLFDWSAKDFIDGIELGGAATYLEAAGGSDITLFI
jgi:peroxiredoxin family protein